MLRKLKATFLFDTSEIKDLQSLRSRIMADNRRFAVIWSIVPFIYGTLCLILSFSKKSYEPCRYVYVAAMIISVFAFICAEYVTRKAPLAVYFSMLSNQLVILGSGLLIAWITLQNGERTVMIFASVLISPILFLNNTLLNILTSVADIVAAVLLLRNGLPPALYRWCVTDLVIFSSMGVTLGHFINKARFERYVFAESAVRLAESNAKIAELQTKYAYYDQMTGLKNRRAYSEKIEQLVKEMPANCCVVMVDCNGLKQINDTLGHAAGDELIVGTAECLLRSFEGVDAIYRLGGDEFSIVLNCAEKDVQSNLKQLEKNCAEWKGQYVNTISISYGTASAEEFPDVYTVLKAADKRMYDFKVNYYEAAGKNRETV